MQLTTRYLGLELPHPLMPGASPLTDDLDVVRRLEDAGAAAFVMRSLFEEQIAGEQRATAVAFEEPAESFAEALSYLPEPPGFVLGPEQYLERIALLKRTVDVPVIASLNGTSEGRWLEYAGLIEEAGADALELNVYQLVTDFHTSAEILERQTLQMVRTVRERIGIPLAVKLSPFYSALGHFASEVQAAGADGLVLFNRFYQADIDVEELEVDRTLHLSRPAELLLRLRWLAILAGRVEISLAVTGGVHEVTDVVKALMAGADGVQIVSVLLQAGPDRLGELRRGLSEWLEEHEYESLEQLRGSMSLRRCPDPSAYERANYMHILQTSPEDRAGW